MQCSIRYIHYPTRIVTGMDMETSQVNFLCHIPITFISIYQLQTYVSYISDSNQSLSIALIVNVDLLYTRAGD